MNDRTTTNTTNMKKIIRYNAANARMGQGKSRMVPTLSMQARGQFRLNSRLMELLGAKLRDEVEIIHDEGAGEWYLAKVKDGGIPLNVSKHGGTTMNSVVLQAAIEKHTEVSSGRFTVAEEPHMVEGIKCYAILMGSAKARKSKAA